MTLLLRWLRQLNSATWLTKLLGIHQLAALPPRQLFRGSPRFMTLLLRWLRQLNSATWLTKLLGIHQLAALPPRQLFRGSPLVYDAAAALAASA
ncbi:hypothetical protein NYE85_03800 [Serratia sp. AKBS12]|nr:hypothetical protein [Serratia sp. AKBS12]